MGQEYTSKCFENILSIIFIYWKKWQCASHEISNFWVFIAAFTF